MSAADIEFVSRLEGSMVSGVAAAVGLGELLQAEPGAADLYVSASVHDQLGPLVAAVPDRLGSVALKVVPDEVWVFVEALSSGKGEAGHRLAPRAAVALDLMESGGPRHWVAAENLIEARG